MSEQYIPLNGVRRILTLRSGWYILSVPLKRHERLGLLAKPAPPHAEAVIC